MTHAANNTGPRWLIVMTVLLGTVTVSLNNSALNPAVPEFMTAFSIGPITASWIITGFLISMGMTMPITGFLSHRFSKRTVYLTGLTLFVCGSLSGTLATTMPWVIAARVLQGIAGGLMIPLSLALIFEVYPKDQRGNITGIWGAAVMLAPAVGPAVGGLMLQFYSWHVLFAMNIPTGLVGLLIGIYCLPINKGQKERAFDWTGFLLVTLGVGILLAVLSQFRDQTALSNPVNLSLIAIALLCLVLFVRVELIKQEPLLCLRTFTNPSYSLSVIIAVVQTIGMFSCIMILPLLMQTVLGHGPIWTGLALLATAVFASAFVNLGGKTLDKQGPKSVVCIGLLFTSLATMAFGLIDLNSPLWVIFVLMIARGIGIGLSYMTVTTAGLNAIPDHLVAQGSAMNNILRRIFASITIVLVSIYFEVRSTSLNADGIPKEISGLTAINEIFMAIGLLILVTLPLALLLPNPTRTPSKEIPKKRIITALINFRLFKGLLLSKQTTSNQKLNKVET